MIHRVKKCYFQLILVLSIAFILFTLGLIKLSIAQEDDPNKLNKDKILKAIINKNKNNQKPNNQKKSTGKAKLKNRNKIIPSKKDNKIRFKHTASIGDPVTSSCITRCHIDYPFHKLSFKHSTHSLEKGFKCVLCHIDSHVEEKDHGLLSIKIKDCNSCHHDNKNLKECADCHLPVNFIINKNNKSFDHGKHSMNESLVSCTDCHDNIGNYKKKDLFDTLSCEKCHHLNDDVSTCRKCHSPVYSLSKSENFKDFNHGLHANSKHLKNSCWSCHTKDYKFETPVSLECSKCHHSTEPDQDINCEICHDIQSIQVDNAHRDDLPFNHTNHVNTKLQCYDCHSKDIRCDPIRGDNCGNCHHLKEKGCRDCHKSILNFNKRFLPAPGGAPMIFPHAAHEFNFECMTCHKPGVNIRNDAMSINCALCHHNTTSALPCSSCHSRINNVRKGIIKSKLNNDGINQKFKPDPMMDIVSCTDCHYSSSQAFVGLSKGKNSCSKCHTDDYNSLMNKLIATLQKEYIVKIKLDSDYSPPHSVLELIHNINMALHELKSTK